MSESIQEKLEKEAGKALIQRAFFRTESALVVAGTILLTVFLPHLTSWWPIWAWPLAGLIIYAALVASTLTDPAEREKVIESLFRERYDIKGIQDPGLRAKLEEADKYRASIQAVVEKQPKGPLRDRVKQTADQVYEWIANMVKLARQIDAFRNDPIIFPSRKRSLLEIKTDEIKDLKRRLAMEGDPRKQDELKQTLASTEQQCANLEEIKGRMDRADLQLDQSLAALGTVYAQILLVGSRDVEGDQAERLQGDVRNEVMALQDLVSSLNEVYSYQTQSMRTMLGPGAAAGQDASGQAGPGGRPPVPPKQSSAGRSNEGLCHETTLCCFQHPACPCFPSLLVRGRRRPDPGRRSCVRCRSAIGLAGQHGPDRRGRGAPAGRAIEPLRRSAGLPDQGRGGRRPGRLGHRGPGGRGDQGCGRSRG